MIYISCSAIVENNEFQVSSVYVIGDSESYMITEGSDWTPIKVNIDIHRLSSIIQSQKYYSAPLVYSNIRQHDDDDPKAFASFIRGKIRNGYGNKFNTKLFKVLSNIGEEWKG